MSLGKLTPPLDGSLTVVPGFIDFHATYNPSSPWVVFPNATGDDVENINFSQFAEETNRLAHLIRPGRQGEDKQVVAVLLHYDTVTYLIALAGVVRAGFIPFPMSPRNSPEAVCSMLEKTACHRVITRPSLLALSSAVQCEMKQKGYGIDIQNLPALHMILPSFSAAPGESVKDHVEPYPAASIKSHPDDIVWYLHSSGSTGPPKPIPQTQRAVLQWASCDLIIKTRDIGVKWCSAALPTFHTMGVFMQVLSPLTSGEQISLFRPLDPAPPVMPNSKNLLDLAMLSRSTGLPVVPAFIEVWAQHSEMVEYLASIKILGFAGGPLSATNGAKLAKAGVPLYAVYGATEVGTPTCVLDVSEFKVSDSDAKSSSDWEYMRFQDELRLRWVPQGDGTYEMQVLTCDTYRPSIENLPDVKGYATSDLWVPHPKKKDLWRIIGRIDDVIVLGTGEKIVPIPHEGYLGSLSFVAGAVMFGRGQTQAGILLELRPERSFDPNDERSLVRFRDKVWPHVEEANKLSPNFARIFKEYILVVDPARPLPRTGKGTIVRKLALTAYEHEITKLYEVISASAADNGVKPPSSWDIELVEEWLLKRATIINKGQEPTSITDIFDQGFDSLSATYLRNRIVGALKSSPDASIQSAAAHISSDFVFTNPTLQNLAAAIVSLIHPDTFRQAPKAGIETIDEFLEKYSINLPAIPRRVTLARKKAGVVLLTGSTGNLGSHVLADLLSCHDIDRVYTLDRGSSPAERQRISFEVRGLPVDSLGKEQLRALSGDLSSADLDLDTAVLKELRHSVTYVVHNAWKVDFNLSISSFESHVANTRNLIDICASFANPVMLFFLSSVSAAQGWKLSSGTVPEDILPNPEVAVGHGYGSSKYTVEQLLARAAKNGLRTVSLRTGQISGSTKTGAWNQTDWVPAIIKSSITLGSFPDLPGNVSWVPMDIVSRSIVDIIRAPEAEAPGVLNIVHPHPVPWSTIFGAISKADGCNLPLEPFNQWLLKVEAASASTTQQDLERIPAIKLLRFYLLRFYRHIAETSKRAGSFSTFEAGGFPVFQNEKSQSLSVTLRKAEPLTECDVQLWMKYWAQRGFLAA